MHGLSIRLLLTLFSSFLLPCSSVVPSLFLLLFPYQSRMVSVSFPYSFRILSASGSENDRTTKEGGKKEERRTIREQCGIDTRPIRDGAISV